MKLVALVGGSGAGKSTVLRGLCAHFGPRVSVLHCDDYYLPKSQLPVDDQGMTNFDLPEVIDHGKLIADIDRLRAALGVIDAEEKASSTSCDDTEDGISRRMIMFRSLRLVLISEAEAAAGGRG